LQIHERDAVRRREEHSRRSLQESQPRSKAYDLIKDRTHLVGAAVPAGVCMRKLRAAVEREFGEEKGVVDPGAIYAHTGFHYYGHFIHADQTKPIRSSARQANVNASGQEECPGDAIVIRVAPKYIGVIFLFFFNFIY
jgi:hypothetical protein